MIKGQVDIPELLAELGRLPPEDRAARLESCGPLDEVLLALVEAAARLIGVDGRRAIEATGLVMDLADAADVPVAQARARRARARSLAYAGRFPEALAVCHEAIEIATRAHDPVEAGRARLASMHALGELGHLDEAIVVGSQARDLFLSVDETALAARADNNLGIVHQRRDQPFAALECFDRARPLLATDPLALGHLDNSRGEALKEINDFDGAEAAYLAALHAFESADASLTAAIAEGNLADLATREGRLQRALYFFEAARRRLEPNHSPAHAARLLAEQAEAKAILGLPGDARREYEEALRELDGCGLTLEAARARCGLGFVLLRLDRPAEAETALAAAATAFDELGHATARARVDLARAELALGHGRPHEAGRMATRALAALRDQPAAAAGARHVLALVALADGDLATADADLGAALAAARRFDLAPLLADILATRGALHRRRDGLDAAVRDLREAVEHVERIRGSLQAERFRAAVLGDHATTYEALVGALLDRAGTDAVAEAFACAEQAKSRSLLDRVAATVEDAPGPAAAAPDPAEQRLQHRLVRVRSELNALYSRLGDERSVGHDAATAAAWQDAVHEREQEATTIESRLATTRGGAAYVPPLALEEVQSDLEPGTTLLEYFVADGQILAFVVEPDRALVCRHLASVAEVTEHMQRLRFQIDRALLPRPPAGTQAGRRDQRRLEDAQCELAALHAALLAPLRARLAGARRLTIIPHGVLHLVPFHALFNGDRYLVQDHEIHTAPSASLGVRLGTADRGPAAAAAPLVVGVADDVAPRIIEEAKLVGRLLGCGEGRVLTGDDATAERVTEAAAGASVIHLAAHGRFLRDNPFGSGLRLADRWLTVRDICGLRLQAEMITLSGCETGLNLVHAGDELLGLLRSFFLAGARSLLVSLWRVDDESAARFMSHLYGSWHTGAESRVDMAARLRAAQLTALAERPHPAFWAPFALVGRP